jgi:hypothetical protein
MENRLRIKRETWPEVTEIPHFVVELIYEDHSYMCDDIYFGDLNDLILQLKALKKKRKGTVEIDGGFRFKVVIKTTSSGGISLNFKVESDSGFPGKMILEGSFPVEGENTEDILMALIKLLREGKEFIIK